MRDCCREIVHDTRNGLANIAGLAKHCGVFEHAIRNEVDRMDLALRKCPSTSIDFVFFDSLSLTGKAIKFFTRSKWGHVGIKLKNGVLIEAWRVPGNDKNIFGIPKLQWNYSSFKNHTPGTPYEIWSLHVNKKNHEYGMAQYKKYADCKMLYSNSANIGHIVKWKIDGPGMNCSEGSIRPLVECYALDINPAHVSPEDLYRMIQLAGAEKMKEGKT